MFSVEASTLSELRKGIPYTWGKLVKIHDVGPSYSIVEFERREPGPNHLRPANAPEEPKVQYTAYVGEKEIAGSYSFDGALLLCIAHGRLEANEARYMAMGAAKLLGVPRD